MHIHMHSIQAELSSISQYTWIMVMAIAHINFYDLRCCVVLATRQYRQVHTYRYSYSGRIAECSLATRVIARSQPRHFHSSLCISNSTGEPKAKLLQRASPMILPMSPLPLAHLLQAPCSGPAACEHPAGAALKSAPSRLSMNVQSWHADLVFV